MGTAMVGSAEGRAVKFDESELMFYFCPSELAAPTVATLVEDQTVFRQPFPHPSESDDLWAWFDTLLGLANGVDRLEGLIMSLRYGDDAAARRRGFPALAGEV
jgi:hypothetical protein